MVKQGSTEGDGLTAGARKRALDNMLGPAGSWALRMEGDML